MNVEWISRVELDSDGRLHVVPAQATFPYIYREAMEVGWDAERLSLHSPVPCEWSLERWFDQIVDAARQQGYELVLTPDTIWVGVDETLKRELLASAASLDNSEQTPLPRWGQILAGLLFLPVALICLAGSLMMVFMENEKAPVLAPAFGVVMSVLSIWASVKAVQMIFAFRPQHGLIGPIGLKLFAWFFLLLPLAGLFTGYFVEHPIRAVFQTIAYVFFFFGIMHLAKQREQKMPEDK